jgi:hypothetical protein
MRNAHVKTWIREAHVPAGLLASLRELNHRFLDLIAGHSAQWQFSVDGELTRQITPLSAVQKNAAANCPYALFDLRFHDEAYWQMRLRCERKWVVADDASMAQGARDFVRLALFFAWHVASTGKLAPPLLLGMSDLTAAAFRGATIDCLSGLAESEAEHLTARWSSSSIYWRSLAGAASQANSTELRRIQLYGLQLAAAARLETRR